MKYYVYILYSMHLRKFYFGSSSDADVRLKKIFPNKDVTESCSSIKDMDAGMKTLKNLETC